MMSEQPGARGEALPINRTERTPHRHATDENPGRAENARSSEVDGQHQGRASSGLTQERAARPGEPNVGDDDIRSEPEIFKPRILRLDSRLALAHTTLQWLSNSLWILLIWRKLEGELPGGFSSSSTSSSSSSSSWWAVFAPTIAGHLLLLPVKLAVVAFADRLVSRQIGPPPPLSASAGTVMAYAAMRRRRERSQRLDGANDAVECVAVLITKMLFCDALHRGSLQGGRTPLRLIFTPLWVGWVVTTGLHCLQPGLEGRTGGLRRSLACVFLLLVALKVDHAGVRSWEVVLMGPFWWCVAMVTLACSIGGLILTQLCDGTPLSASARPPLLLMEAGAAGALLSFALPHLVALRALQRRLDGRGDGGLQTILGPMSLSWLLMWGSSLVGLAGLRLREAREEALVAAGAVWSADEGVARQMRLRGEAGWEGAEALRRRVDKMSEQEVSRLVEAMMAGRVKPRRLRRVGEQLYRRMEGEAGEVEEEGEEGEEEGRQERQAEEGKEGEEPQAQADAKEQEQQGAPRVEASSAAAGSGPTPSSPTRGSLEDERPSANPPSIPVPQPLLQLQLQLQPVAAPLTPAGAGAGAPSVSLPGAPGSVEPPTTSGHPADAAAGPAAAGTEGAPAPPPPPPAGPAAAAGTATTSPSKWRHCRYWSGGGGGGGGAGRGGGGGSSSGDGDGGGGSSSGFRRVREVAAAATLELQPFEPKDEDEGGDMGGAVALPGRRAPGGNDVEGKPPGSSAADVTAAAATAAASAGRGGSSSSRISSSRPAPPVPEVVAELAPSSPSPSPSPSPSLSSREDRGEVSAGEQPPPDTVSSPSNANAALSSSAQHLHPQQQQQQPPPQQQQQHPRQPPPPPEAAPPSQSQSCFICFDGAPSCVFLECGHGGFCRRCAYLLFLRPPNECPTCRAAIAQVVEIEEPAAGVEVGGVARVK